MASDIEIKQGLDVNITGAPSNEVAEYRSAKVVSIYPGEIEGIKPRLEIREGDKIAGGDVLFFDKKNPAFKFRSPFAGTIKAIVFGPRRALQEIKITVAARGEVVKLAELGQRLPDETTLVDDAGRAVQRAERAAAYRRRLPEVEL